MGMNGMDYGMDGMRSSDAWKGCLPAMGWIPPIDGSSDLIPSSHPSHRFPHPSSSSHASEMDGRKG